MIRNLLFFGFGVVIGLAIAAVRIAGHDPVVMRVGQGWVERNIEYPPCPSNYQLTPDLPDHDERNTMSITCTLHNPDAALGTDASGKTID